MVEFVGEAPAARAPNDGVTNSTAELERDCLGQERREAERLDQERFEADQPADVEQLRVEQEQQRTCQERMEARARRGRNRGTGVTKRAGAA